jgi:hypothetical protein
MTLITTISQLQRAPGWWWADCAGRGCGHFAPIAIAAFVIRWGPNAPADKLRESMVCRACGHRGVTLRHVSWVDTVRGWKGWPVGK